MSEKEPQDEQTEFPTIAEFEQMSVEDKYKLFVDLPIPAQKLLIGTTFSLFVIAPDANPLVVKGASKLTDEEFEEAKKTLLETPYFSETKTGRLAVVEPMKDFINTDLKRIWQEQQRKDKKSK